MSKADLADLAGRTCQAERESARGQGWLKRDVVAEWCLGVECGRTGRGLRGKGLEHNAEQFVLLLMEVNSELVKALKNCSVLTRSTIYNNNTMVWRRIGGGELPTRRVDWRP